MGKKRKAKKNRKLRYTRKKFIKNICSACGLCEPGTDPEFCFDCVYKEDSKIFINSVLPDLKDVKGWLTSTGYEIIQCCPDDTFTQFMLKAGFCQSNFCKERPEKGSQCKNVVGCLFSLQKQIKQQNKNSCKKHHHGRKRKNKQKKKNKVKPKPVFFCNDSFWEDVRRIVDENNAGK